MTDTQNSQPDTLPQYFRERVREYGDRKIALRQKELGIWQEFTWQQSYEQVRDLSLGLTALGLEQGQPVSIVGDNDRQYLWADIAIMAAGGVTVGIFTDATPEEVKYVVNHSGAVLAFAKDQEQCDKFLAIREEIPTIERVIYWDPKGMWYYEDEWLMAFEDLLAMGSALHEKDPERFERMVDAGSEDDLCNLCYTSGTTGNPKGAMLTHQNFIAATDATNAIEPRYDDDDLVSFSPLAWIAEHTLAVAPHCINGIVLNFPEAPGTVQENIREIAPDIIFFPARLWENLTASIQIRIKDSTWYNRLLYNAFLPIGYKVADRHFEHKPVGPLLQVLYWLGDLLVFLPLREELGLHNVRTALTAGAALSPDMVRYFRALGLNLKQVYASTETAAVGTQHRDEDVNFASVGKPLPGIEVRIAEEDDEIIIGGENIFHGYHKNPEATEGALIVDEEGRRWFRTGDAGYINEEEHVIYLDRVKDMIELRGGERFSPQFIEGRLKFSPYIRDVMTYGNEEVEYVTAIISIDFENVGRWAEKNQIVYTTFVDLSQKPEVYDLILNDVEEVNSTLPPAGQVRKFVLLHKEFDADEAEMTRTRKLRRGYLADQYEEMLAAMYEGREGITIRTEVQYQDGRTGIVETEVKVMEVDEMAAEEKTSV